MSTDSQTRLHAPAPEMAAVKHRALGWTRSALIRFSAEGSCFLGGGPPICWDINGCLFSRCSSTRFRQFARHPSRRDRRLIFASKTVNRHSVTLQIRPKPQRCKNAVLAGFMADFVEFVKLPTAQKKPSNRRGGQAICSADYIKYLPVID